MLLITRRTGEAIVINGTIEVKVLEVKGGRVKLGFEYPVGNSVFRQELFSKIMAENQAAALSAPVAGAADLQDVVQNLHSKTQGNPAEATSNRVLGHASSHQPGKTKR